MMSELIWCGYNGFNQFLGCKNLYSDKLRDARLDTSELFDCISLWNYNAFQINNKLYIIGAFTQDIEYDHRIKKICGSDEQVLVLLDNGDIYRFLLDTQTNTKLDFLNCKKTNSIGRETITDIACGTKFNVAITNKNSFYTIPIKSFEFPKETKIRQICCGNDHAAILNGNGDVFVWGSGLRGQHGNGEVTDLAEYPVHIEALRGIKIIEIACGGWHVAAISSFNDLYIWGWNSNGQVGHKSVVTSIPTLIDFGELNIKHVSCGLRHTVVLTDTGKLFSCGWNKYGQLGVPISSEREETKFCEIQFPRIVKDYKLKCGNWQTLLIKSSF